MRRLTRAIAGALGLATLTLATLTLATLTLSSSAASAQERENVYLLPGRCDEIHSASVRALDRFMSDVGQTVRTVDAENRADIQLEQMKDAVETSPAAIILAAIDVDALKPQIDQARKRGARIMILGRPSTDTPTDFTAVVDTAGMGKAAAGETERLLRQRNGAVRGKVLQVLGDPADPATLELQRGFEETMKPYADVEVMSLPASRWDAAIAGRIVADQLGAHPDLDLVFVHSSYLAVAAVASLKAAGKKPGDVLLVSSKGAPAGLDLIRQGWAQAEVEYPLYAQMASIARFTRGVVMNEEIKPGRYDVLGLEATLTADSLGRHLEIPASVITRSNVDDRRWWGNRTLPTETVDAIAFP